MDTRPSLALTEGIPAAVLRVPGAKGVEKVLLRKMGPQVFVDVHLEVDPALTVREAHEIAHN